MKKNCAHKIISRIYLPVFVSSSRTYFPTFGSLNLLTIARCFSKTTEAYRKIDDIKTCQKAMHLIDSLYHSTFMLRCNASQKRIYYVCSIGIHRCHLEAVYV